MELVPLMARCAQRDRRDTAAHLSDAHVTVRSVVNTSCTTRGRCRCTQQQEPAQAARWHTRAARAAPRYAACCAGPVCALARSWRHLPLTTAASNGFPLLRNMAPRLVQRGRRHAADQAPAAAAAAAAASAQRSSSKQRAAPRHGFPLFDAPTPLFSPPSSATIANAAPPRRPAAAPVAAAPTPRSPRLTRR